MQILQLLLVLFPVFPLFHGGKTYALCPSDDCGDFPLYYPFILPNSSIHDSCSNYINLACNPTLDRGRPVVDLPPAGEFYVRDIDYYEQFIQLYDPGNCTMQQLLWSWDLSKTHYKAIAFENYTFYMCPSHADTGYSTVPINCLSNSTNSTVAIKGGMDPYIEQNSGCNLIGSWLLPVAFIGQFEFDGVNGDLYLTWNSTTCEDCDETQQSSGGSDGDMWDKFASRAMAVCFAFSFVFMYCTLQLMKCRRTNQMGQTDPTSQTPDGVAVAASQANTNGLDESTINICTELVQLDESKMIPRPDSDSACSVCLDSYEVGDTVRTMAKCGHCFHAHCIELWLTRNRTCPVCRTTIIDVSAV